MGLAKAVEMAALVLISVMAVGVLWVNVTPVIEDASSFNVSPLYGSPTSKDSGVSLSENNLIQNPSFEEGLSEGTDDPLHWTTKGGSDEGSKPVDSDESHYGDYSWKFDEGDETYQQGYHKFIPVELGEFYELSTWIMSEDGNERAALGWQEYDSDGNALIGGGGNLFVLKGREIPTGWTKFSGVGQIWNAETESVEVKLLLYGDGGGAVWWDDLSLVNFKDVFDLEESGCENSGDSKCIDFGAEEENPEIEVNLEVMSKKKPDGAVKFRNIEPGETLEVKIPEFNTGADGLPLTPMLLEIRYQDKIDSLLYASSSTRTRRRAFVESEIQYYSSDPLYYGSGKQYTSQLTYLGDFNDNKWKTMKYVFQKTDFMLLRAIDGKFSMRIIMPNQGAEDEHLYLPIDYINLRAITLEEALQFKDGERKKMGFYEVEIPHDNPEGINSDLVVFSRDIMDSVYKNTKPRQKEIGNDVAGFSTLGETATLSFSIYSGSGIENLEFDVSDLMSGGNKISQNDIEIYHVVYDEKRTRIYPRREYALLPDRIEEFSFLDVDADSSERIWIKVHVPEDAAGGLYQGGIDITQNNALLSTINMELDVAEIQLDEPEHINVIYYGPYTKVLSSSSDETFKFYSEIGFVPLVFVPYSSDEQIVAFKNTAGEITGYDFSGLKLRLNKMIEKGVIEDKVIIELANFWNYFLSKQVFGKSGYAIPKSELYDELSRQDFVDAYGLAIDELIQIGEQRGVEVVFSAVDEAGNNPYKRILADRLYTIIKGRGGVTMATYSPRSEEVLAKNAGGYATPDVIPSLENLVDYKVFPSGYIGEGFSGGYDNFGYYTTSESYLRNPIYNRFLHGLMAFKTDAKMVSAYAMGEIMNDPYNDFDAKGEFIYPFTYPDFLFVYPTWSGRLVPTMSSEGIREGVKDARYIATLKRLIEENKDNLEKQAAAQEAQAYLDSVKSQISANYRGDYVQQSEEHGFYEAIMDDVSGGGGFGGFSKVRRDVLDYILGLGG